VSQKEAVIKALNRIVTYGKIAKLSTGKDLNHPNEAFIFRDLIKVWSKL
jgi:hypothetical protein